LVEIQTPVAILDEHELKDDDGNVIGYLSPKVLQRIADNNNRRIRETGDEVPLVIGHTRDGAPEERQPEVIGFASNFCVKKFFNTGKQAIFTTWKVYPDKKELLKKFPRRSVELWLDRWEIDPISLLGATTPDRNLGLVRLSADGDKYTRTMGDNNVGDSQQTAEQVAAILMESAPWKFLETLYKQFQEGGGDQQEQPPAEEEAPQDEGFGDEGLDETSEETGDELPEDIEDEIPFDEGEEQPPTEEEENVNPPVRKSAASASAMNTDTPRQLARNEDSFRIKFARQEKVNQSLISEVNTLQVKLARAEREKDLIQLEAEGFEFDRDEELKDVETMSEDRYKVHLSRIRKRYQRAPIGGPTRDGPIPTMGATGYDRASLVQRAIDEASAAGEATE
jgi:hypothetical protein